MRFLFFNIVVGAALLYLYNGGDIDLSTFANKAKTTTEAVVKKIAKTEDFFVADAPSKPRKKPSGHARDFIEEPAPKPTTAPKKPKAHTRAPLPKNGPMVLDKPKDKKLPAIENPMTVAKHISKAPTFGDTQKSVSPEIAQRRAEVFGEANSQATASQGQKFALKEGSRLMSVSDRRQALESLAEEMEMLFLENVGG